MSYILNKTTNFTYECSKEEVSLILKKYDDQIEITEEEYNNIRYPKKLKKAKVNSLFEQLLALDPKTELTADSSDEDIQASIDLANESK